jgi:hypothetical protein
MDWQECSDATTIDVFDNFSDEYLTHEELYEGVNYLMPTYQSYFSEQYDASIMQIQKPETFLFPQAPVVVPSQIFSCTESNTAPYKVQKISTKHMVRPVQLGRKNINLMTLDDLKYAPSEAIRKCSKSLARYNALYDIMKNRYKNAKKICCGISFDTIPALRDHIEREHKNIISSKDEPLLVEYRCSRAQCTDCPYGSIDAALSHFIRKNNRYIFSCPDCAAKIKSYTTLYRHYHSRCEFLDKAQKE